MREVGDAVTEADRHAVGTVPHTRVGAPAGDGGGGRAEETWQSETFGKGE